MIAQKTKRRNKIRKSIRKRLRGSAERPRLSVFRSNKDIYVVIELNNNYLALFVEAVIGIQKVVIEDFNENIFEIKLFVGGALMGDGLVSLIIDVEKLFDTYNCCHRKIQHVRTEIIA